ncbi:acetyltransferase [Arenibacter certesii]|uniref:Hexapeptide transferase n=1 Tax=Arenibacter certesii TaxID=228955 RepID=A0A918IM49_9FLAO|nr:acetyltransferase [Arenibacter certesii]GGW22073.1 hexapeptide transferase [Arenibacter certesii]
MKIQKNISFIGYSGHAYVCIETAQLLGYTVTGYHDFQELEQNPYNLRFLGPEEQFEQHDGFLFGSIGNNNIREKVFRTISAIKRDMFVSLLHPSATLSKTATIDTNVLISAGAIVNALSNIGIGAIINTGAIVEHECTIKAFAHIAPGATLAGNVTVGKRSFIGAGAVVKQGVTIGNDVIVGAGAVIIKDIPDNLTVVGNPAKRLIK